MLLVNIKTFLGFNNHVTHSHWSEQCVIKNNKLPPIEKNGEKAPECIIRNNTLSMVFLMKTTGMLSEVCPKNVDMQRFAQCLVSSTQPEGHF